jgi:streptomycin 6-kinase
MSLKAGSGALLTRPDVVRDTLAGLTRAAERWRITLEEPYAEVHPGNLVYRCTLLDGRPAVIKTEPDRGDDEFFTGLDALLFYAGRGMVRVLEAARDDRVVLMERVVPGETLWHAPIDLALEAIASVMRKLCAAPPTGHSFPDVRAYLRAWPEHLRRYGGPGPIDADLFEIGERLFIELCDSSASPVLLHGDLHYGNVLSSEHDGWLAIDPKGVLGEPCYEVGDLFRNRVDELHDTADPVMAMRRRVEMLADLTGFDRERIRLWSLAQAVLSEIWSTEERRASRADMRAARLLEAVGPLG